MADSKVKTDHGDAGRSASESEEQIRETEGGDTPVDDDEWGFFDKKPGLASETKAGVGIIVLLICTFCFLVYRKYDARQQMANNPDGDHSAQVPGEEVTDIQPSNGAGRLFDDNAPVGDTGPPQRDEPQPLDKDLFASDESQKQPGPNSELTHFDDDDTNRSPAQSNLFDEPSVTTSGEATGMTGDIANLDEFDDGFSEPSRKSGFDDSFDSTRSPDAPDVAAANKEQDVFGDEPIGAFDASPTGDDPLFDDTPSGQKTDAAQVSSKPIADDFFVDGEPAAVVERSAAESKAANMNNIRRDNDAFDNPPAGLLFDEDPMPAKPEPAVVRTDPLPSRDELIAADRAAGATGLNNRQTNPMDEINTVRAKPLGRFDDSLFDDDPNPSPADPAPVAKRVDAFPAADRSDDALLFDDSIVADTPSARSGQTSTGQSSSGSVSVKPPAGDLRSAKRVSKFSDPPHGQMLFSDEPARSVAGSPTSPDHSADSFDDAIFDDRERRSIPAETAVLRREDISDVYVVQPGDNYWRISKIQYGTSRFYMALARLNKQRVEDPRRLRPGMKLHTPTIEKLIQRYPELFPNGVHTVSATRSAGPDGFFIAKDGRAMFRTGPSDTLSTIAQDHLGRASRWKQIYQLNRSTLENPNEVKDGLLLVLPDDASQVRMVH